MSWPADVEQSIKSELLCIADSNWVLGHWYINCMLNGRELTDFTSMAGIAEDKLGHTRALFRFMEDYYELPEYQLEFGRSAESIHSLEMLDVPPQNWGDFVLALYLADVAIWKFSDTLRGGDFALVANLITKFGEESYFHQLCIDGWLKALDRQELADLVQAFPGRVASVLRWFTEDNDPLIDASVRTKPLAQARSDFAETVLNKLTEIGCEDLEMPDLGHDPAWDHRRRRSTNSALPARLWESIVPTSDEALLARRPLAVSVKDNIDLFGKIKKDETEPQF